MCSDNNIVDGITLEVGKRYWGKYKYGKFIKNHNTNNWEEIYISRITSFGHAWNSNAGGIVSPGSYYIREINSEMIKI
jgi:hypothetical protein